MDFSDLSYDDAGFDFGTGEDTMTLPDTSGYSITGPGDVTGTPAPTVSAPVDLANQASNWLGGLVQSANTLSQAWTNLQSSGLNARAQQLSIDAANARLSNQRTATLGALDVQATRSAAQIASDKKAASGAYTVPLLLLGTVVIFFASKK